MEKINLGWIGLGNMGIPMVQRLIGAGYQVSVYNRTKGKEKLLNNDKIDAVSSPHELAINSAVIFIMVSDDRAVKEVFMGVNGLLNGESKDKIFVNMSTISPDTSREMELLCKQKGCSYLDAPVSGSVKQAEDGTLVIMVGGNKLAYEKVKPLLDSLGKLTLHLGPCGAGNSAKLAVNTLLGIITQGLAEVVLFAEQMNVNPEYLLNILGNGAMGSPYLKIKGEALLAGNFKAAFALKHLAKDLKLAKSSGLNSPLGKQAEKSFDAANATGHSEEDVIAIMRYLQSTDD
jgi:3-hydroxyisobutyrate dehydrogenase and related beta-hydroxyacid dehydrogenases